MPKKKKYKWDVAISFAGEDRKIAKKLATALKAKGASVFYDKDHKSHLWGKGTREFDNIYGPDSRFVIPIISEHYAKKDWPRYEFSAALKESKKRTEEFILPLRIDNTQLLGLHDDINYIDLKEDSIREAVKAFLAKCKMVSKTDKAKQVKNNSISVLSRRRRHVLGIIATSVFPLELINFHDLFPKIEWQKEIRFLRHKGLVIKQKRSLKIQRVAKNAILCDSKENEELNQTWIEALEPLKDHTDTAIMLSLHYMHLNKFDEAVTISTNMVERMEPDWWSNLYLVFLKGLANKKLFGCLKPTARIRLYNAIGLCLSYTGKNDEAVKWFLKLRRYSLSRRDKWGAGQSYLNCGAAYHKSANYKKAKTCYVQAIKHARKVKDDLLLGHSLNNLAQIVVGDSFEEAEKLINESISIKKHVKNYTGLVASYGTLGYLAACNGNYKQARKWFSKSQRKAKALGLRYSESLSLFNLGNICFDLGEFNDACFYYRQSHEVAKKKDFIEIIVMNIEGEAKACFEMGRFRKAELKFRRLYELKTKLNHDEGKLIALNGLASSLIKQSNMPEARKIVHKALKLARELNDLDMIVKLSIYKALTYGKEKFSDTTIKKIERQAFNEQRSEEYFVALRLWTRCIAELISAKNNVNRIEKAFENGMHCLKNLNKNYEVKIAFYVYLHSWQWQKGNYQEGIEALKNIEKLAVRGQLLVDQARAIDQRGVCLQELGKLKEAELAHKKALKLARQIKDKNCIGTSLNNLGEVFRKTNRYRQAIKTFLEAEQIAEMIKDYESEISTAHNRALALEGKGDFREAKQLLSNCRDRSRRLHLGREYVRSWEALGNLAWNNEDVTLATKRFKKALLEAKKYKQRELQPEIALNLARILLYQGKSREGLQVLKPYEEDFLQIINSCEYYGTLGELYKENNRFDLAEKNYILAKKFANKIGAKDRMVYFCSALAELYREQEQPKPSDAELKEAIKNEKDPEGLAYLFLQRFDLLLDGDREKLAKQVFKEATSLMVKHGFTTPYIDIHMIFGDHNWKGNYKAKFNAMQAYIVALGECFLHDTEISGEIGSHIIEQLLWKSGKSVEKLIDKMEKDITQWLLNKNGASKSIARCLLWPLRVAKKMYPCRLKPYQLEKITKKIVEEETLALSNMS